MTIHMPYVTAPSRRVRRVQVSADFFVGMLAGLDGSSIPECRTPIPEDARVVGLTVDERYNTIQLYVESSDFDEVIDGMAPPDWQIEFGVTRWPGGRSNCKTCYGLRVVDDWDSNHGEFRPKPCPDCSASRA